MIQSGKSTEIGWKESPDGGEGGKGRHVSGRLAKVYKLENIDIQRTVHRDIFL